MLPGQMSLRQFKYVQDGLRNLPLRFGHNQVSNSRDIADIEFLWGGWGGGGWGGLHSHFHVQPPTIVGLRLRCS